MRHVISVIQIAGIALWIVWLTAPLSEIVTHNWNCLYYWVIASIGYTCTFICGRRHALASIRASVSDTQSKV